MSYKEIEEALEEFNLELRKLNMKKSESIRIINEFMEKSKCQE